MRIHVMFIRRSLGVGGRYLSSEVLQGGTQEDALWFTETAPYWLEKCLQALAGRKDSGTIER